MQVEASNQTSNSQNPRKPTLDKKTRQIAKHS